MINEQAEATRRTEKALSAIEKEIIATYETARKAILSDLESVYARYLAGIKPEDYYNEMIKFNRYTELLTKISKEYGRAAAAAGKQTAEASMLAMSNEYYQQQFVLDWFVPGSVGIDFTILPPQLLELSVTGNIENWLELSQSVRNRITSTFGTVNQYIPKAGTLSDILASNRTADLLKLNRTISSSLIRGVSYAETARDVSKVMGTAANPSGSLANALRVVRTESNRTLNAGAYANSQQLTAQGVVKKRQWVATLDTRTRDSHAALDGQQVEDGEDFVIHGMSTQYPGGFGDPAEDIQCRCTVIDVIDGVPPEIRRGTDPATGESTLFTWKNFDQWAEENGLSRTSTGRLVPVSA